MTLSTVNKPAETAPGKEVATRANRKLDLQGEQNARPPRKRKSKVVSTAAQTLDLNLPPGTNAIVPAGLVSSRVNQLDASGDSSGGSMIETLKKQKRNMTQHERSAAAVDGSPRRAP